MDEELTRRSIIDMILWLENEEKLQSIHAFLSRFLDFDPEDRSYR